jgi:hypothetical protein
MAYKLTPAAVWLFASGLGLLGWFRRRPGTTGASLIGRVI